MTRLPLLPRSQRSREIFLQAQELPDNYMGDFTLMGMVVSEYVRAVATLEGAGFRLSEQPGGAAIDIHSAKHLQHAVALLQTESIDCTLTDIADSIYQA